MRIGVLTGGGDCPGLDAVIRSVVRRGNSEYGYEVIGYRDGWKGPMEGDWMPLGFEQVHGILTRGGTILGSSRTNPVKVDGGIEQCHGQPVHAVCRSPSQIVGEVLRVMRGQVHRN